MPHEPANSITTDHLIEEMGKLRAALSEAREKRHDVNGVLNDALLSFQVETEDHEKRLLSVEKVMMHEIPLLIRDIQIIKTRIIGDDGMKIPGFYHQMTAMDVRIAANSERLVVCEQTSETVKAMQPKLEAVVTLATAIAWDIKVMKIIGGAVTAVLITLGGLITWVKATDVIKFLGKS